MDILPQLLFNALITGSIYALLGAGLALTYGLLKVLNFAHGHLMMLGAYLFYLGSSIWEYGLISSSVFAAIATILASIVIFWIFVQPFTQFSLLLTFVTTLALSHMLEAIVAMCFGVNIKSLYGGSFSESFEIAGVYMTPIQVIIVCSTIGILSILAFIVHSTSFGRRIRALAEHPQAAEAINLNQRKTAYVVFTVSCLLATYAGVMVGYETNLQPTMGASYTIKAFAAMVLGGLGSVWGAIIGSYLLGLVENLSIGLDFGDYSIPAGYKDAFAFIIILFVLLLRPQGLFGKPPRGV